MTKLATAEVVLGGDNSPLSRALSQAEGRMQSAGRAMGAAGRTLSARVTAPLALIAGVATKSFADFDSAMTQSIAIMGDVSSEMEGRMSEAARDVARTTTLSATEAAESYFFLASAGLDAEQSIAALPQVAKFAQAGMFDMATATDLATDAQSALGLASDDAATNLANMARVTDVLVKANTLANATVQQFSTALTSEAGSALKTFNKDIEEGVAVLGVLADQGVKAEKAGSGLSRILRLMSQAAVNNKGAMEELGIEFFDAQGNMRPLADVVENLTNVLGPMSDETRSAALESIGFTARVQGMLLPLLGTSDAIREYEEELREAGGTTGEVADKQLESFSAQMTIAKDNIMIAAQALGETLAPVVLGITEGIASMADAFTNLPAPVQTAITVVGGLAAALGPALTAAGALTAAIGAMSIPVAGTVAALGTLAATAGFLAANWTELRINTQLVWTLIKDTVFNAVDSILLNLEGLAGFIPGLGEKVGAMRESFDGFANESLAKSGEKLAELEAELRGQAPAMEEMTIRTDEASTALDSAGTAAADAGGAVAGMSVDTEAAAESVADLQRALATIPIKARALGTSFDAADRRTAALRTTVTDLIDAGYELDDQIPGLGKTLGELAEELREAEERTEEMDSAIKSATRAVARATPETDRLEETLRDLTTAFEAGAITQEEYERATKAVNDELAATNDEMSGVSDAMRVYTDLMEGARTEEEKLRDVQKELNLLLDEGKISQEEYNEALGAAEDKIKNADTATDDFLGKLGELRALFDNDIVGLDDEFNRIFTGIRDAFKIATEVQGIADTVHDWKEIALDIVSVIRTIWENAGEWIDKIGQAFGFITEAFQKDFDLPDFGNQGQGEGIEGTGARPPPMDATVAAIVASFEEAFQPVSAALARIELTHGTLLGNIAANTSKTVAALHDMRDNNWPGGTNASDIFTPFEVSPELQGPGNRATDVDHKPVHIQVYIDRNNNVDVRGAPRDAEVEVFDQSMGGRRARRERLASGREV